MILAGRYYSIYIHCIKIFNKRFHLRCVVEDLIPMLHGHRHIFCHNFNGIGMDPYIFTDNKNGIKLIQSNTDVLLALKRWCTHPFQTIYDPKPKIYTFPFTILPTSLHTRFILETSRSHSLSSLSSSSNCSTWSCFSWLTTSLAKCIWDGKCIIDQEMRYVKDEIAIAYP